MHIYFSFHTCTSEVVDSLPIDVIRMSRVHVCTCRVKNMIRVGCFATCTANLKLPSPVAFVIQWHRYIHIFVIYSTPYIRVVHVLLAVVIFGA